MKPSIESGHAFRGEDFVIKGLVVLVVFILAISFFAVLIWLFSTGEIPPVPADQILVHSRAGVPYKVAPEPVERMIFILLALFSPSMLVAYFWIAKRGGSSCLKTIYRNEWLKIFLPAICAIVFVLPFVSSDFIELLFFPLAWEKSNRVLILGVALLISLLLTSHGSGRISSQYAMSKVIWWCVVVVVVALQILSYRVGSIYTVTLSRWWSVHVDAALYALNQVVHGRTIIADLPSQYGFFPEIISPLFQITGLSVLSFTVFFAVLQAVGIIAVAVLLREYIKYSLLAVLVLLAISIPMGLFFYLNGSVQEIYVQYFPIRFFGPALGLLLFSFYAAGPSKKLFLALGVVSGLSVFWNIDTGVPVLISIGATLLVKPLITRRSLSRSIRAAFLFGLIASFTVIACFIALRIKAGVPLDLAEILESQRIFYITGFGMIPMPVKLDPWQAVIVIYAAGAITALSAWQRDAEGSVYDVLLCSAILGLGLFAYYQGRSHVNCLILACWPAIFIGGVLTDLLLRGVRNGSASMSSLPLAIPFAFFAVLGAITFIASSENMFEDAVHNISNLYVSRDPVVADELGFMRDTYRGRNCLILSQRQAIYAAELNIASPLNGPGLVETLLQRDLDRLVSSALRDPLECVYLGVAEGSVTFIDVNDAALMQRYPVISKSPLGTIMLLEPRSSVSP